MKYAYLILYIAVVVFLSFYKDFDVLVLNNKNIFNTPLEKFIALLILLPITGIFLTAIGSVLSYPLSFFAKFNN